MTLSKQTFRRGHGFASLFPSMDMKSFPLGSKCAAFGPYDSYIILGSHFQPRSFFVLCCLRWVMDGSHFLVIIRGPNFDKNFAFGCQSTKPSLSWGLCHSEIEFLYLFYFIYLFENDFYVPVVNYFSNLPCALFTLDLLIWRAIFFGQYL